MHIRDDGLKKKKRIGSIYSREEKPVSKTGREYYRENGLDRSAGRSFPIARGKSLSNLGARSLRPSLPNRRTSLQKKSKCYFSPAGRVGVENATKRRRRTEKPRRERLLYTANRMGERWTILEAVSLGRNLKF